MDIQVDTNEIKLERLTNEQILSVVLECLTEYRKDRRLVRFESFHAICFSPNLHEKLQQLVKPYSSVTPITSLRLLLERTDVRLYHESNYERDDCEYIIISEQKGSQNTKSLYVVTFPLINQFRHPGACAEYYRHNLYGHNPYDRPITSSEDKIAAQIELDLMDRACFREVWKSLSPEYKEIILETWRAIAQREIRGYSMNQVR